MTENRISLKAPGMVILFLISLLVWTPPAQAVDIGDPNELQAQDIRGTFDSVSEETTITWRNINDAPDPDLFSELWDATYHIYRHDQPIDSGTVANLTPFASVVACDTAFTGMNSLACRGKEDGTAYPNHTASFPVPPGINGSYFYGITTELADGTITDVLDFNASTLFDPVEEITTPVRSPYLLMADFSPSDSMTHLTWVNYNLINPVLPEIGDDAYQIHIWRSDGPITRSNGINMLSNDIPIAVLDAGTSSYDVVIPESTTRTSYYAVTYVLPNWTAPGNNYEDVRFLSNNSLEEGVYEDTIPPSAPTTAYASFNPDTENGTGLTTISWSALTEETGESYRVWMAGVPFNSTDRNDIELIATVQEGFSFYEHSVDRGQIGYTYYCVEIIDQFGVASSDITCANPIYEDTFTPWIAEPTNVAAEYLGDAKTRVTWTDQIGAEGESYNVWWSNFPVPGSQFSENQSLYWVATVPDGFGEAIVDVPIGVTRDPSYYFVTSEARYAHLNGTYQYTGLVQNMADPIIEDTLEPDDARITELTMVGTTNQVVIRWVNDVGEENESYHIYRHSGDPFGDGDGVTSNIDTDAGWELVIGDIPTTESSASLMANSVSISEGINQDAWYAVIVEDEWDNVNPNVIAGLGGNALQITEDTIPPNISVMIDDMSSATLLDGAHRLTIHTDEELSGDPMINISSDNGVFYTIGTVPAVLLSDNLADPTIGPTYYFDFTISNTDGYGNLTVLVAISDANYNYNDYNYTNWNIDSIRPTINIYSPGSATDSKYMYGSDINVHGSVVDDVGIDSVQIKFTYNYRGSNQATSPWLNFPPDQLTWHDNSVGFSYTVSAADFQPGEHRVEIKVVDLGGNPASSGVTFLVDSCHHTVNGTTVCAYEQALKPDPEPIIEEVKFGDPPYIFVFGLAGLNIFAFLLTLIVITVGISGPRRDDDEDEGDDWMKEFIGTSAEPDMAEITGAAPATKSVPDVAEDEEDEDDPFAVNVLERKTRRKKGSDDDSKKGGRRVAKRKRS